MPQLTFRMTLKYSESSLLSLSRQEMIGFFFFFSGSDANFWQFAKQWKSGSKQKSLQDRDSYKIVFIFPMDTGYSYRNQFQEQLHWSKSTLKLKSQDSFTETSKAFLLPLSTS